MNKLITVLTIVVANSTIAANLTIQPGTPLPRYSSFDLPGNNRFVGFGHTIADLNKDNRPDILAVTHAHKEDALSDLGVRVYLQESNGSFRAAEEHIVNNYDGLFGENLNMRIMVGDVNEDGYQDFLVENFGDSGFQLYTGKGNGTFHSPTPLNLPAYTRFALLRDVNSDAHLDLIGGGSHGGLSLFQGDGKGAFSETEELETSGLPGQIQVGDVNNDGKLDIVVASLDGLGPNRVVDVFLGKGNGRFDARISTRMNSIAGRGNALADLNGDGKLDYVADERDLTAIQIWLGRGDGTFARGLQVAHRETAHIRVADVNDDSIPDLVAAPTLRSGGGPLSIFLGKGDGTFESRREFSVGANRIAFWPEFADLNGDGRTDIVAQAYSTGLEVVGVFLNTGRDATSVRPTLLTLEGSTHATNVLESSIDLQVWVPLTTNTTTGIWRYYHDSQAQNRFYRSRPF